MCMSICMCMYMFMCASACLHQKLLKLISDTIIYTFIIMYLYKINKILKY